MVVGHFGSGQGLASVQGVCAGVWLGRDGRPPRCACHRHEPREARQVNVEAGWGTGSGSRRLQLPG